MIEFFVGLIVFAGVITVTGFILYVIGKFILKIYDVSDITFFPVIIFAGITGVVALIGIITLCVLFYGLGKSILN